MQKMIKILFPLVLICFCKQANADEKAFLVKSDTLGHSNSHYNFLTVAHNPLSSKKVKKIKRYRFCPVCRRDTDVVPVVYGYTTHEMFLLEVKGEIKLGGCVVNKKINDYCKKDMHYF